MKINEDVLKALQNAINSFESINEFSKKTNVKLDTLSRFLTKKTRLIQKDTWDKLYPLLQPYLNEEPEKDFGEISPDQLTLPANRPRMHHDLESLTSDEKILLDAFAVLDEAERNRQLLAIVELAKNKIQKERTEQ